MQPGEAVWRLQALLLTLERKGGTPGFMKQLAVGKNAVQSIAEFVSVSLPTEEEAKPLINEYTRMDPTEAKAKPAAAGVTSGEVREVIELCDRIIAWVGEAPDKAEDFAEGVLPKAESVREFCQSKNYVSEKQRAMIENIWAGCQKWQRDE